MLEKYRICIGCRERYVPTDEFQFYCGIYSKCKK